MKAYMLALVAAAFVPSAFLQSVFAEGMLQSSSGNSLDILVEPQWGQDGQAQFRISFLQPGTDVPQIHIDYDLTVTDSTGNKVFSAAEQTNQPILHTEPGVVTIPYKFEQNGLYTITVDVVAILFIPITPESADFPVTVVPEFPAGTLSVIAAVTAGTIAVARMRKL